MTSRLRARKAEHLIADTRMRFGEPCWTRCDCGWETTADTPELLVEATRAHRREYGLQTSGQQRSGDGGWDGSWAVAW